MTSIMMNSMDIGRKWCRMELRQYIKPKSRVVIVGFCPEGEKITTENEWNSIYGAQNGAYYGYLTEPFKFFGVNSFEWINILKDSPKKAAQKIKKADILLLPHGVFPDMIEVIEKLNLADAIAEFDKTIIGFGTGAAILLDEYITENNEDFGGLGLIKNMGLFSILKTPILNATMW